MCAFTVGLLRWDGQKVLGCGCQSPGSRAVCGRHGSPFDMEANQRLGRGTNSLSLDCKATKKPLLPLRPVDREEF